MQPIWDIEQFEWVEEASRGSFTFAFLWTRLDRCHSRLIEDCADTIPFALPGKLKVIARRGTSPAAMPRAIEKRSTRLTTPGLSSARPASCHTRRICCGELLTDVPLGL